MLPKVINGIGLEQPQNQLEDAAFLSSEGKIQCDGIGKSVCNCLAVVGLLTCLVLSLSMDAEANLKREILTATEHTSSSRKAFM
jgi:hypothetical protein